MLQNGKYYSQGLSQILLELNPIGYVTNEVYSLIPSMRSSSSAKSYGWRAGTSRWTTYERTTGYVSAIGLSTYPAHERPYRVYTYSKTMPLSRYNVYQVGKAGQMRSKEPNWCVLSMVG